MNNDESELRLGDFVHALIKHRVMIILLTVAGLVIGVVVSFISYALGEISKEYAVTSAIAVTSQTQDGLFSTQSINPNSTDIYLAENMVDSVIYVLKSDKLLNAAIERMELVGIPAANISSHLTLTQYRETQIIEMTFYWRSAEEGVQILNAINDVAPSILVETLKIGGVSVVNMPTARYRVGGNLNVSLWVIAAAAGFALGAGISILMMLFFPTLVNAKDLETGLGLEVLGEIPASAKFYSRRRSPLSEEAERLGGGVREGYASAAHILQNRLGDGPHCLYVTSTARNEGKTSAAANLAVQLAEQENKVLLIDFDVRNPSLGGLFLDSVSYERSLNALYRGEAAPADAISHLNGYLDLLPTILEQRELPLDDAMLSLIRDISEGYDYVIMDTSPVGRNADTMNLNRIAQSVILVVRFDTVGMREIRETLEKLDKSGVQVAGCIVNDVSQLGKHSYRDKRTKQKKVSARKDTRVKVK